MTTVEDEITNLLHNHGQPPLIPTAAKTIWFDQE
jgi:hypothetical protein